MEVRREPHSPHPTPAGSWVPVRRGWRSAPSSAQGAGRRGGTHGSEGRVRGPVAAVLQEEVQLLLDEPRDRRPCGHRALEPRPPQAGQARPVAQPSSEDTPGGTAPGPGPGRCAASPRWLAPALALPCWHGGAGAELRGWALLPSGGSEMGLPAAPSLPGGSRDRPAHTHLELLRGLAAWEWGGPAQAAGCWRRRAGASAAATDQRAPPWA